MANRTFQQMAHTALEQAETVRRLGRFVECSEFPVSNSEMDTLRDERAQTARSVLNFERTTICGIPLVIR